MQPKKIKATFHVQEGLEVDMSPLIKECSKIREMMDLVGIVHVNDPYLINVVEPKAGNTVHTFIEEKKRVMTGKEFCKVGWSIPPETINGYHFIIFGKELDVTIEGLAEWLLLLTIDMGVKSVSVEDGTIAATVTND